MIDDNKIDDIARYWNARPCNIRHSNKEVGSKEYFLEVSAKKYFVEPHILNFAEFWKWKDKKVLELGCGIGTDAASFATNGAFYTGIDISYHSLQLARIRFETFNLPGYFHYGNVEEGDIRFNHQFDLVYAFGVLHHTPNPDKALQAAHKFLKKSGELRIMLYHTNSWKQALINSKLAQPEAQAGCPIVYTYTKQEVRELLESTGFKITSLQVDHIFPYQIEPYKNHEYIKEPYFAAMSEKMFRSLEQELGWHLLIKAVKR